MTDYKRAHGHRFRIAQLERQVRDLQDDLKAANASRVMLKDQRNRLQHRVFELQGLARPWDEYHEKDKTS